MRTKETVPHPPALERTPVVSDTESEGVRALRAKIRRYLAALPPGAYPSEALACYFRSWSAPAGGWGSCSTKRFVLTAYELGCKGYRNGRGRYVIVPDGLTAEEGA